MILYAFTWTEFAQQLAAGIREGAIYAGLALAIVIIYRSTRVINFAQGEMATFTTFIAWSLMNHGLSFWTAFPIVLAIAFAGGVAIERIVIRPVENAPVLTIVIITLGLALLSSGWRCVRRRSTRSRHGSSAFAWAGCSRSAGESPRCSGRSRE